ncbi:MAG: metal-dependent phosphohydrolase [Deltaproteobacteria bacterium]|nr:MAG: metal-dependent phosphohydrolase [Deltaproteobacteria bacterium]
MAKVPTREECFEIMEEAKMPPHIIEHSAQVTKIAVFLAEALASSGVPVDTRLVEAGALLHDISKMESIDNGGNHAALGAELLKSRGYPALSPLVERHVDLGEWSEDAPVDEAEIINYADKRVRHDEIVSLGERFDDLIARYGKTDGARTRMERLREEMFRLEKKLFRHLPFAPSHINTL